MAKNEFICDCNIIHKEVVEQIRREMPKETTFKHLATFFKLIGDETRLRILFVLDQKETCVCDIANILSMSKSSISHQLATLRNSGIVKCRKEGKEVYYSLDDEHVTKVFEVAVNHINHKGEKSV
jgi:ArsR family transcriptional regulator